MQNRIFLAIDGGNYWATQRDLGWICDPGRLKEYVASWGEVVSANYYLSILPNADTEGRDRFRLALRHMGYSVIPIYGKQLFTSDGIKDKANADVRIALDAYIAHEQYDTLVLVSGDGDFAYLLEVLKAHGKKSKIISTNAFVARELLEIVGKDFYDLNMIREHVERKDGSGE